jgi:aspartokinase
MLLGGFKILRDAARISFVTCGETHILPTHLFLLLAEEKINVSFMTCVCEKGVWGVHMVVASKDAPTAVNLIQRDACRYCNHAPSSSILSLFPHKKSPHVMGTLFDILSRDCLQADAIANSPSAVSLVIEEHLLPLISDALFLSFQFSAYRTPEDWKLAQEGKEQLYKEVVASYQEKKPKVYGLECYESQELMSLRIERGRYGELVRPLKLCAEAGCRVTFLATGPCRERGEELVLFCLPRHGQRSHMKTLGKEWSVAHSHSLAPVAVFSMTGPHFGDRYGIISELVETLAWNDIGLLALSCTIASVTGVVCSSLLDSTVQAIQHCFEVPNVMRKP